MERQFGFPAGSDAAEVDMTSMERQRDPGDASTASPVAEGSTSSLASGQSAAAVVLTIRAQSRYIRIARLVAAGLANELGVDVERLDDVRLAIGELCGLAAQAGATELQLRYALAEDTLEVTLDAALDESASASLDADYHTLVGQVLSIACTKHRLATTGGRLKAHLTFTHGH
jgi:hypothetical protein